MINAVLFDLDGTLLDTSEGIIDSVSYTIRQLGYQALPESTLLKFVGPPIQNSLITHLGITQEEAQNCANIFRNYYKTKALFKANLYPDVLVLLQSLKSDGIKVGVATYKREDYAIELLNHFGIADYCDVMHGADNDNVLTKADIVELCIKEMGVDKSSIVLVGDTEHDAKGANDADVGFLAVTWGFGYSPDNQVTNYPYRAFIENPLQILTFINREYDR